MTTTHATLISPRDNCIGLLSADQQQVNITQHDRLRGTSIALGRYLQLFPDTKISDSISEEEQLCELHRLQDECYALDYCLFLFDPDLSEDTKREVAKEFNDLLSESALFEHVLNIMLAAPLPPTCVPSEAASATTGYHTVNRLVTDIIDSQDRVAFACSAWSSMRTHDLLAACDFDTLTGALVSYGVFRRLVLAGATQADVDLAKSQIVMDSSLQRWCNARILLAFISKYTAQLPLGLRRARDSRLDDSIEEVSCRGAADEANRPNHQVDLAPSTLRAQAESQVERIAELYANGQDSTADKFLRELVTYQTTGTSEHSHVVKSLCNIATKCGSSGRRSIAIQCLKKALDFPSGTDAKLFIMIGNELRELRQFVEAIECYGKARELDRGELSEDIVINTIRVSVAKGEYDDAINQYLQVDNLDYRPRFLCALGTVYRKTGRLTDARDQFFKALNIVPNYHSALAGLAESNKQSGKHNKAITRYERIIYHTPDLDMASGKVYRLALSYLLRITGRLDSSQSMLAELNRQYPFDSSINFQLAKMYFLKGDRDRAELHFEKSREKSLTEIGRQLYHTAVGETSATRVGELREDPQSLPIDIQGLYACNRAMVALNSSDYETAQQAVEKSIYIDKLQHDFGTVLSFHAIKRMEPTFNHKSKQSLCRIAKRGHKYLRHSIAAIADSDFHSATESERAMCLLIA